MNLCNASFHNKHSDTIWLLKNTNVSIGISLFEFNKDILEKLPIEEELNIHIDINE